MQTVKQLLLAATLLIGFMFAKADNLWIIGDATPYGWDTDKATALLSTPADPNVFTGTIYLKGGQEFKFMTQPEWGNDEYGAAPGATLENGTIKLAKGTGDDGYDKIRVSADGNYYISLDVENLTASISLSTYQDTHITLCSLFLVGGATPGGWSVMQGTPLYQSVEKPYEFSADNLQLSSGSFKIATALKGAGSWNPEYWYFRDADNSGKIALNQDGDLQWEITDETKYNVAVNIQAQTISIKKISTTGINNVVSDETVSEYYSLTGIKVTNPHNGLYIRKTGNHTEKVYIP
ncbi:MAG: SusF/SusE family outer membrane protein [Muribaculum sp.]|nr:SusF/SusE family outer membrane protein [Muribaculum sp.]